MLYALPVPESLWVQRQKVRDGAARGNDWQDTHKPYAADSLDMGLCLILEDT